MEDLLSSWGLAAYAQKFAAQDITPDNCPYLTDTSISNLFPTEGPRSVFLHHLKRLRSHSQEHGESSGEQREQPIESLPKRRRIDNAQLSAVLSEPDVNDLHGALKKSLPGLLVLGFFKAHCHLDDYSRDLLSQQTLFRELEADYNVKIDRDRFSDLADSIVQLFPSESKVTWYDIVKKGKATLVQGRLRHKYYSLRRSLVNALLIPKQRVLDEALEDEDSIVFGEDEDDEDFTWLLTNVVPWESVHSKWEATFNRRMKHLESMTHNFLYLEKFPSLRRPLGYQLIVLDGLRQPSLAPQFEELWKPYSKFLVTLIRQNKPGFLANENHTDVKHFVQIMLELPHLFRVRSLPKSSKASKSSKCWRPSRAEITDAFFLHVTAIAQVQEKLDQRKKSLEHYKFPLQPVPVVLGPLNNIRQSFIVLDNQRWQVKDPLEAFSGAFRMAFGLNSVYPIEARHIMLFLQQTLFKFETPADYVGDKGLKTFLASRLKDFELFSQ